MDSTNSEKEMKRIICKHSGKMVTAKDSNGNDNSSTKPQDESNKKCRSDPPQMSANPNTQGLETPCMMPLLSIANMEECCSMASIVLAGTAKKGGTGPPVGAVDIGLGKSAYFFRVALPGVKKDPGQFSCEVECDGKVNIHGVASTGGNLVSRESRVFEMKLQQQCPPGPFTLSFSLPGPVDPRLFFPNFRSDGVLEAVVIKHE